MDVIPMHRFSQYYHGHDLFEKNIALIILIYSHLQLIAVTLSTFFRIIDTFVCGPNLVCWNIYKQQWGILFLPSAWSILIFSIINNSCSIILGIELIVFNISWQGTYWFPNSFVSSKITWSWLWKREETFMTLWAFHTEYKK